MLAALDYKIYIECLAMVCWHVLAALRVCKLGQKQVAKQQSYRLIVIKQTNCSLPEVSAWLCLERETTHCQLDKRIGNTYILTKHEQTRVIDQLSICKRSLTQNTENPIIIVYLVAVYHMLYSIMTSMLHGRITSRIFRFPRVLGS